MKLLDKITGKRPAALPVNTTRDLLKRLLAEAVTHEAALDEAQAVCVRLDREADAAALVHGETTEPIQATLAEIEQSTVNALIAGQPADAGREERRKQALAALEAANVALQKTIDEIDVRRKAAVENLMKLTRERPADTVDSIRNRLVASAPSEIAERLFIVTELLGFAVAAIREAERKASGFRREASIAGNHEGSEREVEAITTLADRWGKVANELAKVRSDAQREADTLRERAVKE